MKPALFLSDLHLSPERPATAAAFHAFARGPAQAASAVYILGDLFDGWVGDDQLQDPFAHQVAELLRGISAAGIPLYIGRGNRDFLLGERFARATGAELLPELHVVDVAGIPALLMHGDELCTDDVEYQRYRARMRSPGAARRLMALPYFVRRAIAWYLRRRSRAANARKPQAIMDVSNEAVVAAFRQHAVPRIIHGHTHRPARHRLEVDGTPRERIVLADWGDVGRYLETDLDGIRTKEITG